MTKHLASVKEMCKGCGALRPTLSTPCPLCGYNPNISAKQRRAEKRARIRRIRKGQS